MKIVIDITELDTAQENILIGESNKIQNEKQVVFKIQEQRNLASGTLHLLWVIHADRHQDRFRLMHSHCQCRNPRV